jgi:hypothetical protein
MKYGKQVVYKGSDVIDTGFVYIYMGAMGVVRVQILQK